MATVREVPWSKESEMQEWACLST